MRGLLLLRYTGVRRTKMTLRVTKKHTAAFPDLDDVTIEHRTKTAAMEKAVLNVVS